MKAISLRKMVIAIFIIGIGAGYVRADKLQLQEKLSRDAKIQLNDVTIAQALKKIEETAEVKIILSDEAVWKLPFGEATRLSVSLSGPLADSLTEMLNTFFMRYAVSDDEITIYPRAELEHIIGRPSTKQLELLKRIYSMRLTFSRGICMETVVAMINEGFGGISFLPYDVPVKIYEILQNIVTDEGTLPLTLPLLIEQVGAMEGKPRWYFTGIDFPNQVTVIRIVDEEEFREARLDQVVDVSFDERADVILQRLAGWAGMELVVSKSEASWLEEVIKVDMQNIKLRQALRNIASTVDGQITLNVARRKIPAPRTQDYNEIQIAGPIRPRKSSAPAKSKSSGGAGEGYVGKISIPMEGGKYFIEFMLRESDLTEELKKLREEKIKEVIQKTASEQKRKLIEALKKAKESAPNPPQ
jgi:hypothetical protein